MLRENLAHFRSRSARTCWNWNGDPIRLPVFRSVFGFSVGIGLPLYLANIGLWIEGVDVRWSAVQKQKDYALGFRRKMGTLQWRACAGSR